jgi:hypothetical protein
MKKIAFSVLFAFVVVFAYAQKFSKVETPYVLGKFEDARTEIDKMVADPKNQSVADVWLWHGSIYAALADNASLKVKYPQAVAVAMSSFQKYTKLDPSLKTMNEEAIPGKMIIDVLYRNNLTQGITFFDKKQWDSSYVYFIKAAEIGDLITKYNWRGNKQPIDTTTVLFSGYAAQNAKKLDEAAQYYGRIADLKITSVPAAGDVKDVYEYLVYYYMDKKNNDQFQKYLGLAKEMYPKSIATWADYESEFVEKNFTLAQKAAAYDKADAAGTLTANQYLAYGNMFYNLDDEEKAKMDSATILSYRVKAEDAFIKGFRKDPTNGLAAYNVGLINYNDWVDLDDQFEVNIKKIADLNKSKTAEKDPKKKVANDARIKKEVDAVKALNAAIEKRQHVFADKSIEWMENTYSVLSVKEKAERAEKNVLAKSVDYLANLYLWKRDKSKGNNANYDKYDALYKKYDALHGKY